VKMEAARGKICASQKTRQCWTENILKN